MRVDSIVRNVIERRYSSMKVVVAMSGGIDSSVAAALLLRQGCEVVGLTLRLGLPDASNDTVDSAAEAAGRLGIPHRVIDVSDAFNERVIDYFCREYARGRTPNPCVRCNRYIKFSALFDEADETGAEYVSTGHYARIEPVDGAKRYRLKKGIDGGKDQSYFLYLMDRERLGRVLMPLGGLRKAEVRSAAREMGLDAAGRAESQDICFVSRGNYREFVGERLPMASQPGPIIDGAGNVIGEHSGIASYTVGQRKGLGLSHGEPLYVTAIDPGRNAIIVGGKNEAYGAELIAGDLSWIEFAALDHPIEVKAKIRYRHREAEAVVTPMPNGEAHVKFERPQLAITPGQAVVFYRDSYVIGGGTIERAGIT
ncbi:MAG: tRNA 2-thiouridine(34) synthase MnmA [Chloroflexota bacterium]|nr:tRNA 2-thiouridine(34) synthase MnmA [Chloroflexota bacterium]